MNKEIFIEEVKKLGIFLDEKKRTQLHQFYHLLIDWNQKINLTRITAEEEVYLKHFYDSLTIVKAIDLTKIETLCDVGSGAGFPGIVLKIVFPNLKITLLDSLQKRVNYLNTIIHELQLENIIAIHSRAEEYAKQKIQFDVVTARAVARLDNLLTLCWSLVAPEGMLLAMKGHVEEELEAIMPRLKQQKIKLQKCVEFNLPNENSHRSLVVLKRSQ